MNWKFSARDAIELLKYFDDQYYNGKEPQLTDREYDEFKEFYKNRYPEEEYFSTIGAPVSSEDNFILPYILGSLNKFKRKDINKRISKIREGIELFISAKLNGLSIYLRYDNGNILSASTRGDGETGKNILEKAKIFCPNNINFKNKLELRGEILFKGDLSKYGYSSKMAAASGIIGRDDLNRCKDLVFVCYEIISDKELNQEKVFQFLSLYGFNIPEYRTIKVFHHLDFSEIFSNILKEFEKLSEYEIDGIVICPLEYKRENVKYPKDKFCFKENKDGRIVFVDRVEMNVSRSGRVNPLVYLREPVLIDGSLVTKASGHNYAYIKNESIGPGSKIKIVKSGEIIPYITEVISNGEIVQIKNCPDCGSILYFDDVYLWCQNKNCPSQFLENSVYYFRTLGVENISEKTFQKLIQNLDIKKIEDFYSITREDLEPLEGFGDKKIYITLSEIEKTLEAPLERFLIACGIRGLGEKNCKKLCEGVSSIDEIFSISEDKFSNISGFGNSLWDSFSSDIESVQSLYYNLKKCHDFKLTFTKNRDNISFKGNVAVTGKGPFSRKEIKEKIEEIGYFFHGGIKGDTNILLCEDPSKNSNKLKKAREKGIKIISYNDFFEGESFESNIK
ncbi:MAG: helix-hairpin-helix domain-containing protein [Nanoarchaeota archaeon]